MTLLERIALAVTSTRPTHFLTLQTVGANQKELAKTFPLMKKRIGRRKSRPDLPVIYFSVFAQGLGAAGCHLHLLLWDYPPMPMYHGQAKALGLGNVHVERITPSTPENVLRVVSYALGQQEPVFGTTPHRHHQPRAKHQRRWGCQQRKTLEEHKPELLSALDLAKDKSVSDQSLVAELPTFIRERSGMVAKGDLVADLLTTTNKMEYENVSQ